MSVVDKFRKLAFLLCMALPAGLTGLAGTMSPEEIQELLDMTHRIQAELVVPAKRGDGNDYPPGVKLTSPAEKGPNSSRSSRPRR